MGLATGAVIATLRRGDDIGHVLDGAGTNQRFPVRAPGGLGECRRHGDNVHLLHGAVQLGEAQVVTD